MDRPTILIVDDEPGFAESLSIILENRYNVLKAKDGMNALAVIGSTAISLILLDIQMPGMTGIEFLHKTRKMGIDIPVLMITGNISNDCAIECSNLSVLGYFQKPVDIEALLEKIDKTMSTRIFSRVSDIS